MGSFTYNDLQFSLERRDGGWSLLRALPDGSRATVGCGLYPGLAEDDAEARARALVRTILPVGVRVVGPDVAHPLRIGNLRIVGPDVGHPGFACWNQESVSWPRTQ